MLGGQHNPFSMLGGQHNIEKCNIQGIQYMYSCNAAFNSPCRTEVNKKPLKSNFLSLCKPLRNESASLYSSRKKLSIEELILLSNAILANIFKI